MSRLDITKLLSSMQNLFYRMSHLSIKMRTETYQGKAGREMVEDIAGPLSEHIEDLARNASDDSASPRGGNSTDPCEAKKTNSDAHPSLVQPKVKILRRRMNGLSKLFKKRSASIVIQPHLSDQLQKSVRQHLNTSLRQARQGDITSAKLRAGLASNAMHELAHYMPKEDFQRFNTQISADLKEFRDRDMFKPLTELME